MTSTKLLYLAAPNAKHPIAVILGLLAVSLPVFPQLNLGHIFGAVTDQSGAAISGAMVTITDVSRGVTRTVTTDSAGEYSAPSLVPSTYTVRVENPGFNPAERQNFTLNVGQELRIDLSMQPGTQNQTIVVTGTPPIVNTSSAMISTTIDTQSINELPLNGGLYTKLLDYTIPGLAGRPGGNSPAYSSNGAGIFSQMWMLDGVDDVNEFAASGPLFGAATSQDELTVLPVDAIQEVNVVANPRAEFGWEQGAVVNVGLKSGTNTIHGTAFAYGRDTALDARSPFLGTLPKADDLFEQYGASIGGPIVKDKLFYFATYEGMQYTVGVPNTVAVPSSLNAGGPSLSLPAAIADLQANGVTPSPLSLNLAGCNAQGVCDPTKGVFRNGTTNSTAIPAALNDVGRSDNQLEKIDYHLNDQNSIYGEYLLGNANDTSAGNGVEPWWTNGNHNRVQSVRATWIYVPSSTWVNEARFGYDRYNLVDYNSECNAQVGQPNYLSAYGFASGVNPPSPTCGFPIVSISGFTDLGAGEPIADQLVFQNTWHFVDSVSYTKGSHLIKVGGEFHHTLYRGYGAPSNLDGTISFNGGLAFPGSSPIEDFLAGTPAAGAVFVNPTQTLTGFNRYAGFFQDDWRITRRVTLNLGLRYEYEPPVLESNNQFGNFNPNAASGMVQQTPGHSLYNPDYHDFGPRVGMAWDVNGKGTTVIRAGSSITYDTIPLDDLVTGQGANLGAIPTGFTLYNADGSTRPSPGNIRTGTVNLAGSALNWVDNLPGQPVVPVFNTGPTALTCGNGLPPVNPVAGAPAVNPPPCSLAAKNPNSPRSYMVTWTVGIQHAFTNSTSLNVAYVGNHVHGLPEFVNVNQPAPGDIAGEQFRQPYYSQFPYLGNILQYSPVGYSNYDALQANLLQRTTHGFTTNISYTWAHALGTQGGNGDNFPFLTDSANPSLSYANLDATPRQHLGVTATYDVPGKKMRGQMLEGWELNSTVNIISAMPINASDIFNDFAGIGVGPGSALFPFQGSYWNMYGKSSNFRNLGRTTSAPCYGFPGSSFAGFGCNTAVPQQCIAAATSEPTNPNVPAGSPNATGLSALQNFGCYEQGGSVIVPPAQGTFGNMQRGTLMGAPFAEWDLSVAKNWKFKERLTTQFRAEFFNVTNSRNYAPPAAQFAFPANFGQSLTTVNSSNPINGTGGPREIQLGLKLIF